MSNEGNFVVLQNVGAGTIRVVDAREDNNRGFHESFMGEFETREEAEAKAAELAGEPMWAVFLNVPAWTGYVEEVDSASGNYRGSGRHPFSFQCEFETKEEAEAALSNILSKHTVE